MQLIVQPAMAGLDWIKQGWFVFRSQPIGLCTLFLCYLLAMSLLALIPFVGMIFPVVLMPAFSFGFCAAAQAALNQHPLYPTLLISGFKDTPSAPSASATTSVAASFHQAHSLQLLILGMTYLGGLCLIILATTLVDDGLLFNLIVNNQTIGNSDAEAFALSKAVATGLLLYMPLTLALWYAPALVVWESHSAVKALFFSAIACWRNKAAFLVYGLGWTALLIAIPMTLTVILGLMFEDKGLIQMILLPVIVVMNTVFFCTFYPMYKATFRLPAADEILTSME